MSCDLHKNCGGKGLWKTWSGVCALVEGMIGVVAEGVFLGWVVVDIGIPILGLVGRKLESYLLCFVVAGCRSCCSVSVDFLSVLFGDPFRGLVRSLAGFVDWI